MKLGWHVDIKMELKKWQAVDWIYEVQSSEKWRPFVKKFINSVFIKARFFHTNRKLASQDGFCPMQLIIQEV
jgi:hypothetical protein